ncbi:MAG: phosphonate ABC transporter, permease protein PhnE [Caldiserica bacterium]|nr:phosphonate ABC transporter, permease protein PhnE [Caldisericota bacterium]
MATRGDRAAVDRSRWDRALDFLYFGSKALGKRLSLALLDVGAVAVLWILTSYVVIRVSTGEIGYTLLPWWLVALGAVEAAALWESFGRSFGHRVARLELRRADGGDPALRQKLVHWLLWHVGVIPVLPLLLAPPPHERASGLTLRPFTMEGRIPRPWWRTSTGLYMAYLALVSIVAAVSGTITWEDLVRLFTNAGATAKFWRSFLSPDTSIILRTVQALIVTVFMAMTATAFAVLVAVPLSFLAARNLMRGLIGRAIYTVIRGTMSIIRSIEPVVWAIFFLVWVRVELAPFAGVLALFVHSVSDLTKLYAERLESIDPGLIEAITATGANRLQVLRYAVIPQIVNPYISFTLYRWDINIRMATVVGVVGGGGIGQALFFYLKGNLWTQAGTVMLFIIALVWAIDYLSARLRAKLA